MREALHVHDRVDERVDVGRLRAAHAFEQLVALELVQRAARLVFVERRHAERHVAEHLDEDAAEPDRDDRAEQLVLRRRRSASRRRRSPSRTRARPRCGRCRSAFCAFASSSSYAARTSLADADADLHEAGVALVQQVGRRDLHHDRDSRSRSAACTAAAAEFTSSSFDVLMPYAFSSCLHCHSESASPGARSARSVRAFFAAGDGVDRRVVERRAVARRERPVVGVRLHRGDAVVERAEHGQAAVEQALVVRVVGAGRRAPDDEDRLVGGLRGGDDVARERLAERRDRAGDRDDEDVDVLVGEDRRRGSCGRARRRPAGRRSRPGSTRAGTPGSSRRAATCCVFLVRSGMRRPAVGDACRPCARRCRRRSRTRRRRAASAASPTPAALSGRVRASAADTSSSSSSPSTRVTPNWRNTALVTASEPVRWPVCDCAIDWPASVRPTFTITIGLRSSRRVVGREHQRAAVLEALDVAGDHADLGLVGEVAREVGELEVDLVAGRRPVREPDADLLALEHGPALVARLRDQRDRRAVEVVAELLERVEVRVRAEQAHVARLARVRRGAVRASRPRCRSRRSRPRRSPRTSPCAAAPPRTCRRRGR